jgi:hypothetical protein
MAIDAKPRLIDASDTLREQRRHPCCPDVAFAARLPNFWSHPHPPCTALVPRIATFWSHPHPPCIGFVARLATFWSHPHSPFIGLVARLAAIWRQLGAPGVPSIARLSPTCSLAHLVALAQLVALVGDARIRQCRDGCAMAA